MVISNIIDYIGNTPVFNMDNIFAKAEIFNPGGSIKDRIAMSMIVGAEEKGLLNKDSIIVEPTSGNTGIGIALVGRGRGYEVKIIMPENMSIERRKLILALGADIVLTPADKNIQGAVDYAYMLKEQDPKVFIPDQFRNQDNPKVHYEQTAEEIWRQMNGKVDAFVSGIGSGGTLQGVGKFLKEKNKNVRIIAVEPKNASALLGHEPGLHQIQGIGDGFIPEILDVSMIDEVVEVTDGDAINTTKMLCSDYGLLVGISSGANIWGAMQFKDKIKGNIVTILPDRAERYFSTSLLSFDHHAVKDTEIISSQSKS